MEATIPFYPLIVVPVSVAIVAFWRRGRQHLGLLRQGRELDRSDRPWDRVKGLGVFVFGQKRLLQDIGPGLTHAFVFWGFIVLTEWIGDSFAYVIEPDDPSRTWAVLAGPQINAVTHSAWVKGNRLYVKLTSAAWRQELHLRREEWRRQLNEQLGADLVREIVFR